MRHVYARRELRRLDVTVRVRIFVDLTFHALHSAPTPNSNSATNSESETRIVRTARIPIVSLGPVFTFVCFRMV